MRKQLFAFKLFYAQLSILTWLVLWLKACLVGWPIGCLMASCPKYSTTCSLSLPAADKLLLASDFGETLFQPI